MLEIIVETLADAKAAEAGGATQMDLKSDFVEYGLTPSIGTVEQISAQVGIELLMMVRHYANGMVLDREIVEIMCTDIRLGKKYGADGFLLGALTPDGRIDTEAVARFKEAADGGPLHFHLAWEMTVDPLQALEELIALDVRSVRASGNNGIGGRVAQGLETLKRYQIHAAGRIAIFLAGGVSHENVGRFIRETGIRNVHAGTNVRTPPSPKGSVSATKVHQLRRAVEATLIDF